MPVKAFAATDTQKTLPGCKLNNTCVTSSSFSIIDTNNAVITVGYTGYSGITTGATVQIKLQRKVLFWWVDVDNGQPNDTWVDIFTGYRGNAEHSLRLSQTGKYRAQIEYQISGSGGATDVISTTLYDEY